MASLEFLRNPQELPDIHYEFIGNLKKEFIGNHKEIIGNPNEFLNIPQAFLGNLDEFIGNH